MCVFIFMFTCCHISTTCQPFKNKAAHHTTNNHDWYCAKLSVILSPTDESQSWCKRQSPPSCNPHRERCIVVSPAGDRRFGGLGGPGGPGKPNQSGGGFAPHSLEGLPKPPGPPRPPKTSAQDEPSGSRTLVETFGSKFSPTHCGETCGDNIGGNIGETFGENFHAFLSHTFINFGGGNWWVKVSTTSPGRSPTPMFHQASRSALQGSSAARPCEGARQIGPARQLGPARELGSTALQALYI